MSGIRKLRPIFNADDVDGPSFLVTAVARYWNSSRIMDDDEYVARKLYWAAEKPVTAASSQQLKPRVSIGSEFVVINAADYAKLSANRLQTARITSRRMNIQLVNPDRVLRQMNPLSATLATSRMAYIAKQRMQHPTILFVSASLMTLSKSSWSE